MPVLHRSHAHRCILSCIFLFGLVAVNGMIADAQTGDSVAKRVSGREFPSIFEAWTPAQNLNLDDTGKKESLAGQDPDDTIARHDLFITNWWSAGLRAAQQTSGLVTQFTDLSIEQALKHRAALLSRNPNLVILAAIQYRDALLDYAPRDSPWWKHDDHGQPILGWQATKDSPGYYLLEYSQPDLQDAVAHQCQALVATGVIDGCFFDWWAVEDAGRVSLIKKVRASAGNDALIIVNSNCYLPVQSAPYINGMYMEGFGAKWFSDWHTAANNLIWAQTHFRQPVITALEEWSESRDDYALMRRGTTISLIFSDGYVLFGDPDSLPTPDHLHDFYNFWDKRLGKPTQPPISDTSSSPGFFRMFEHGFVVFNPPTGKAVTIRLKGMHMSVATGKTGDVFSIAPGDGDIILVVGD